MRYQLIGFPVPYKGKPIWEIVGNLKNFGVGRMIVADEHKGKYDEPSFYRIVKVQPMETPTAMGENRKVLLWAEYVLRGKKLKELEQLRDASNLTKFHLIPKDEEFKYMSGITDNPKLRVIPKYQQWPPLYKRIWEAKMRKLTKKDVSIPLLHTIIDQGEKSFDVLSEDEKIEEPQHTDMFASNVPVEELYMKLALLRQKIKKIEDHRNVSENCE